MGVESGLATAGVAPLTGADGPAAASEDWRSGAAATGVSAEVPAHRALSLRAGHRPSPL